MSIALPLMMGLALEQLIGMTDVLFLGRYGEAELAAAGVAGIYVMLVMMLGLGYTVGSQSLMSRANGAGRAEEVGAIFRQSAIFMTACGFVIMLASWFLIGRCSSVSLPLMPFARQQTIMFSGVWPGCRLLMSDCWRERTSLP